MQDAQLIHAAGESSLGKGKMPKGTFALSLTCRDEAELHELAIKLDRAGVDFTLIHEPDPPYNGQLMAIGITPTYRSRISRYLSNLPTSK